MPKDENDDWEDSTICRSCGDDVAPKKLLSSGYCQPCINEAAEGFEDDPVDDSWDDEPETE